MAKPQTVPFTLQLAPRQHQRLHEAAKKHGYSPSIYAQLLFEAAFAARIGQQLDRPETDADLDAQVKMALILAGIGDTNDIARATGLSESLVAKVLAAWREVKRGAKRGRAAA